SIAEAPKWTTAPAISLNVSARSSPAATVPALNPCTRLAAVSRPAFRPEMSASSLTTRPPRSTAMLPSAPTHPPLLDRYARPGQGVLLSRSQLFREVLHLRPRQLVNVPLRPPV